MALSSASANQVSQAMVYVVRELMAVAMVLSVMRMLNVSSPSMINHFSASVGKVGRVTA